MFNDDIFENWLDSKSKELVDKISNQEALSSEEMIILVLKAQSNHFHHLDDDMRTDMNELRVDMNKRFEQVDKRFDAVILRMDRFMIWSLGLTMTSTFIILGFMYKMFGK